MINIKNMIIVGFVLTILSCSYNRNKTISNTKINKISSNTKLDDSIKNHSTVNASFFDQIDSIFPVFSVSSQSFGLFIELNFNDNNELNKLFNKIGESLLNKSLDDSIKSTNLKLEDSLGYQKLFSNQQITNKLNKYIGNKFQIYCINGKTEAIIKDVVFHISDCQTNYVLLRLNSIDENLGHPIFATQNKMKLKYGNFNNVSNMYNNKEDEILKDYPDNKHITFFAKLNNYYFGYRDDFKKYKEKKGDYYSSLKVYFPYRKIIKYKNNSIKTVFSQEMDVFGVPCD